MKSWRSLPPKEQCWLQCFHPPKCCHLTIKSQQIMGLKLDETTILENALIYNTIKIIFLRIFKSHGRFSWLDFIGKVQFIFLSKRTSFLQLRKIQRIKNSNKVYLSEIINYLPQKFLQCQTWALC